MKKIFIIGLVIYAIYWFKTRKNVDAAGNEVSEPTYFSSLFNSVFPTATTAPVSSVSTGSTATSSTGSTSPTTATHTVTSPSSDGGDPPAPRGSGQFTPASAFGGFSKPKSCFR